MKNKFEKTNIPGLYKDPDTGAVINKDTEALQAYKRKKAQQKRTLSLEQRIERLEKAIQEYSQGLKKTS